MVVSEKNWKITWPGKQVAGTVLLVILAIVITSCGGGSSQQTNFTEEPVQANNTDDGSFPSPAPSILKGLNYLLPDLDNRGNQFVAVADYPAGRVTANDTSATFSPDWDIDRRSSANLAFATYAFNIPGYDLDQTINFGFSESGEFADAWVGLANYVDDKWDWFPLPENLAISLEFADYLHPETETLLVLPLFMGTHEWILERVWIGPGFESDEIRVLDGFVYEIDGVSPKRNVAISVTGDHEFSAVTNLGGYWVEYFVPEGNYTVTPYEYSRRFFPGSRDVTLISDDLTVEPFLDANVPLFQASGLVLWPNGITPMPFIDVKIQGDDQGTSFTGSDGIWTVDLPNGDYTVRPVSENWTFTPEFQEFTINENAVGIGKFIAQEIEPQRIEGFVFREDGETPLQDVTVFVDGEYSYQKTTDIYGYWRVMEIYTGEYRVTPFLDGMVFEPEFVDVTIEDEYVELDPFIASHAPESTIDGMVVEADNGNPVADVLVTIWNRVYTHETTTDADGVWSIDGVHPGDYSVIAQGEVWSITPDEYPITVTNTDLTVDPFLATLRNPYAVFGYIMDEGGTAPLGGIEVWLTGNGSYSAFSGEDGFWIIPEVLEGNYLVQPFLAGRVFDPESQVITVTAEPYRVDNFTLVYHPRHTVSGFVWKNTWPEPLPGAKVVVANMNFWFETTTDSEGNFQIDDVLDSDYYIWCVFYGYDFDPLWYYETLDGDDLVVAPFEAILKPTYRVDGNIFEADGFTPMQGVDVSLEGRFDFGALTDANGYWFVDNVFEGDYEVSANKLTWEFAPDLQEFSLDGADQTLEDFLGSEMDWYNLEGHVYQADGTTPFPDVQVVAQGDITRAENTDASGYFSILIINGEYSVAPQKAGFTFTPSNQIAVITNSNLMLDDFLGSGE